MGKTEGDKAVQEPGRRRLHKGAKPAWVRPAPRRGGSRTGDGDGPQGTDHLIDAGAMLLVALLLFALAMVALRLPSLSTPETVDVTGAFERIEWDGGSSNARRLVGSHRVLLRLRGDAVAYSVSDPGGFGWQSAADGLRTGDWVTQQIL